MRRFGILLLVLLAQVIQVKAQGNSETESREGREKVVFKVENIALYAGFVVSQKERVYIGETPPQIGRSYFEGFVKQPIGLGYDLSLTYFVVRKKGFLIDIGFGVWSYSLNYRAIEDSVMLFNPGSRIRQYYQRHTIFNIPISVNYQIKKGVTLGVKASLPVVSESKLTSPDSTLGFKGHWKTLDWNQLLIEGRIGYEFQVGNFSLTPSFYFGGVPLPTVRGEFFYKLGLSIRYHRNEK